MTATIRLAEGLTCPVIAAPVEVVASVAFRVTVAPAPLPGVNVPAARTAIAAVPALLTAVSVRLMPAPAPLAVTVPTTDSTALSTSTMLPLLEAMSPSWAI